jgi:hypothetical protein
MLGSALAAGVVGVVAGAGWMASSASLFERYGVQDIAPMVVALASLRGWSVWGSILAPAVVLAAVLHREGARAPASASAPARDGDEGPGVPELADAALAGASSLVVYACMAFAILVGALAAWSLFGFGAPGVFWRRFAETVMPADLELGVGLSLAHGVIVAALARTTARVWTSRAWGLVPKLLAAGGGAIALLFVEGILLRAWPG